MGIYTESQSLYSRGFDDDDMNLGTEPELTNEEFEAVKNKVYECMMSEALNKMSDEARSAVLESEEFEIIAEAKKFKKKTIVKLNAKDDLARREAQAAIIIAGERNDPLYDKLALNRVQEKKLLKMIHSKYKTQARKAAKEAQRDYVKDVNKSKVMSTKDLQATRRVAE